MTVRQPLPSPELEYLDPFVLLHHAPPTEVTSASAGAIEAHPHRGFSPVTFVFKGSVHHRDSRGHDSTVAAGGTQWMHAGSGIIHEESPLPGEIELIQLWINSPARHKMDPPAYYPLTPRETPQLTSNDGLAVFHIVSGSVNGITGPIPSLTPVNAVTIEARRGGALDVPLPASHNAFIYLLDGSLAFADGRRAVGLQLVVFRKDGKVIGAEALEPTRALLMSGEPIGERIVSMGPFVMNTDEEIRTAFRDYRAGRMGQIPDFERS